MCSRRKSAADELKKGKVVGAEEKRWWRRRWRPRVGQVLVKIALRIMFAFFGFRLKLIFCFSKANKKAVNFS
jgi:hypothetical protein